MTPKPLVRYRNWKYSKNFALKMLISFLNNYSCLLKVLTWLRVWKWITSLAVPLMHYRRHLAEKAGFFQRDADEIFKIFVFRPFRPRGTKITLISQQQFLDAFLRPKLVCPCSRKCRYSLSLSVPGLWLLLPAHLSDYYYLSCSAPVVAAVVIVAAAALLISSS